MYAIKADRNHLIAIVDDTWVNWFKDRTGLLVELVPIGSVGSTSFVTDFGTITAISAQPVGTSFSKDALYLISSKPDDLTLGEAYKLIS
jgi:hypothetical protein